MANKMGATEKSSSEFILSAVRPEQFPEVDLPEIAFLGRSNVGKSSLLNCLVGQTKLAFTSSRPGCTQAINFFRISGEVIFADLPGYGYAKVPKDIKYAWKSLIDSYLLDRKPLALSFLLIDSRHGFKDSDRQLREWLTLHGRPYLVVATKIDKVKQSDMHRGLAAMRRELGESELVPFSALTGQGAREIWQAIKKFKTRP
jgi:GTP-binding protein